MSPLREYLEGKRRQGAKILSIYLTAGYPDLAATVPLLHALADAGADLIELGVPFSDPMADGPTIQAASQRALAAGATLQRTLGLLHEFKSQNANVPVLLMGYANPFMQMGWQNLVRPPDRPGTGAGGFIVPDLPPEESATIREQMQAAGLDLIFLASPNTTPERLALINAQTTGFIYAVSVTGVTGARAALPAATEQFLIRLRETTTHPVLVGFGVANATSARRLARLSDGVIIGSAVIDRIAHANQKDVASAARDVAAFVREIKTALGEHD